MQIIKTQSWWIKRLLDVMSCPLKKMIKLEHFKFNSNGHFNSKISILGALNHFVINNYWCNYTRLFICEVPKEDILWGTNTARKMKFVIKDFFSKCNQTRIFLRIWSHLLKKFLMENFFFCAVPDFLLRPLIFCI